MDRIDSSYTSYRVEIYDISQGESVVEIFSDSPILVPDEGEKLNLVRLAASADQVEDAGAAVDDSERGVYVVESREYLYVGSGVEEDEGSIGCGVTLEVTPVEG